MRRLYLASLLFVLPLVSLLLAPALGGAQGTTREQINRAIAMYNNLQVEAARPILLNIISPSYLQQVQPDERVDAYKYLGASYAVLGAPDTAATYFVAALDFDPFTDLDVDLFGPQELDAFNKAKRSIFKAGIAPVVSRLVNPRVDSTHYAFRVITTSRGQVNVTVLKQTDSTRNRVELFNGSNEGLRQVRWNGVLTSGQFADTGIYLVRVTAQRDGGGAEIREQQFFRIEHHHEPLEDLLPEFRPEQKLVDRISTSAPYMDLAKGIFAAAATFGIAQFTLNQDVKGYTTHVAGAGVVGLVAGTWSFLYRRNNRTIADNARENARREAERARYNTAVQARNDARLDARLVIITPIAGFSR